MVEEEVEGQKISKYNSAIAQLYRIDALWKDTHVHSRAGLLDKWNWDLDRVWCELAADANNNSVALFEDFKNRIKQQKALPNTPLNQGNYYVLLLEKEIFLRKLQNEQGKGTAFKDEFEDDIE